MKTFMMPSWAIRRSADRTPTTTPAASLTTSSSGGDAEQRAPRLRDVVDVIRPGDDEMIDETEDERAAERRGDDPRAGNADASVRDARPTSGPARMTM